MEAHLGKYYWKELKFQESPQVIDFSFKLVPVLLSSLSREKSLSRRPMRSRVNQKNSRALLANACSVYTTRSFLVLCDFHQSDLKPLYDLAATVLNIFVLEICICVSESKRG